MDASRCLEHDLALDPHGVCVLCRRGGIEKSSGAGWLLAVAGLLLSSVTVAGVVHVRGLAAPKAEPIASAAPVPMAVEAAPVDTFSSPGQPTFLAGPQATGAPAAVDKLPTAESPAKPTEDPLALRAAARSVNIVVYTTTWCPQCRKAKAWMDTNDVRYQEHDIEASESDLRACKLLNPKCSIPTVDIDGAVIVGFGPESYRAAIDRAARRRLAH